jgi:hypothetical protein
MVVPLMQAVHARGVVDMTRGRNGASGPIVFDTVTERLVVSGLPDAVAGALLLAVLPSHLAEVGGRRLITRTVDALSPRVPREDGRRRR